MPELSIVIAAIHGPYDLAMIQNRCRGFDVEIILITADIAADRQAFAGVEQAKAERIAILGDRYDPAPNWIQSALGVSESAYGGVLPPPALTATGWAIYLAEYSHPSGPVEGNTVFPRHSTATPIFTPGLQVVFARPPSWNQYLSERYRDSRKWARRSCSSSSRPSRMLKAASRIALPLLLLWRRAGGPYPARFLAALPYLLVSGCVEAAGEIAGFLSGEK